MLINYHVTGSDRKRLVAAIADHTGEKAKYLGAPSFAYQVGGIHINTEGSVTIEDNREAAHLIRFLRENGFQAEDPLSEVEETKGTVAEGLTVGLPTITLDEEAQRNLASLLEAKGSLIRKALNIPSTPIEVNEQTISFPWFNRDLTADEIKAYTHFIGALCEMAKNQKRITAKEKEVDNEKYAFRCFLLRLGFIGNEYKGERKVLLRNLSGSSAFKSGAKGKEGEACD